MDKKEQIYVENNRRKAISKALQIVTENDVIVIAGKGHEDYQIIKDKRIHFKDKEVVYEELNYKSGENWNGDNIQKWKAYLQRMLLEVYNEIQDLIDG